MIFQNFLFGKFHVGGGESLQSGGNRKIYSILPQETITTRKSYKYLTLNYANFGYQYFKQLLTQVVYIFLGQNILIFYFFYIKSTTDKIV